METENKDWKPEVGKTAWLKRYPYTIEQVMIIADGGTKLHYRQKTPIGEGEVAEHCSAQDRGYFFETPEAALASIKIYDLEGKEVVIPRAEPVFSLDEMVGFFNKWIKIDGNLKLFLEAQAKQRPQPISMGKYIDRARQVVNSDIESMKTKMMLRDELGQRESSIDKLQNGWELFEAYKASKERGKTWGVLEDRALQISLTDEAGAMNYSWETCLEMARNEGGGAANGGKSKEELEAIELNKPINECDTIIPWDSTMFDRGGKSEDQREGGC